MTIVEVLRKLLDDLELAGGLKARPGQSPADF
jgi:hypothetical protein